ncbi:hypothetical protein IC617_06670 [Neiella sp. HB171785]|uniref:Uncharacterized protein n=1 Tax=Neiella litorisoli TaxID=2771431 RepID=A0A8J6QI94_9GAMM|nr:hypothetical protein [Neiella litorisoli]MBD1389108.1 hypothetical protein [Neiella litorisoli]
MSQQNLTPQGQAPMKAEQAWALMQVAQGNTLPRGKVFDAYRQADVNLEVKAAAEPKPAAVVAPAESKPAATADVTAAAAAPAGLSDAQAKALAELQAAGDWVDAKELSARKNTLDALVKKELAESQEQDGAVAYKAK